MSITNILKSIGSFLSKLLPWAKNAINHGKDVANEIKGIVDNPAWDVAVSFTSTKLDDAALKAFRMWLDALVVDMGIAYGLATKSPLEQASVSIKSMEIPEAKAGTLNTIAAAASTKIAELKGQTLPIETTLAAQQPAYLHPELLA